MSADEPVPAPLRRAFDEIRFGPSRTLNLRAQQPTAMQAATQVDSLAAVRVALPEDAAVQAALPADAVAAPAAMSDAAGWNCGDRRLRRTLNPRSSFYPPCRCSDAAHVPVRRSQRH